MGGMNPSAPPKAGTFAPASVRDVFDCIHRQEEWRSRCLNLIASENVLSPLALRALSSDFVARYAEGHPGARWYEGTRYIDEIEARLTEEVRALFRSRRADVRPVSGTVAWYYNRNYPPPSAVMVSYDGAPWVRQMIATPMSPGGHIPGAVQ